MTDQPTDEIGNPAVEFECPECGESESVSIGPTMGMSFKVAVTPAAIKCSECDYNGPPVDTETVERTNVSLSHEIENL